MDLSNLLYAVGWDGMGRLSIDHRSIGKRSKEEADWIEKNEKTGGGIFNPFLSERVSCGTNKLVMVSPRGNKSRRNLSRYYRIKTTLSSTGLHNLF